MSDYLNTNSPTADNPFGTFKNESQPNAGDGTNIVGEHLKDLYYSLFQVLQLAGELPNSDLENGNTSKQFIRCLTNSGIFKYDSSISYKKNSIVINTNSDITKFYRSKIDANTNDLNDINYWSNWLNINSNEGIEITGITGGIGFLGQIIPSVIPITDSKVHLLDGSIIVSNGMYSAFATYLKSLVSTYPNLFCTEAVWQSSIVTYGQCSKFVIDDTANTIRLPKITEYLKGISSLSELGTVLNAGLPDHSHKYSLAIPYDNIYGREYPGNANAGTVRYPSTLNASASNPIYGRSTTVTPNTANVAYYIVLSTSINTDVEIDINNVVNDLNLKTDTNASNITDIGKSLLSGLGMPSSRYTELTLGASGSTYTAPANGWYFLQKVTGNTALATYIQMGVTANSVGLFNILMRPGLGSATAGLTLLVPILKGQVMNVIYDAVGATNYFRFIYSEGAKND